MHDLKKFEYVITIAHEGSISQGAQALHIAQPTLSKYIKKLESDLGVELFDRSTIPIMLTPAGECFVEAGRRLIDMENQLQKQLQEIRQNKNTVIRIGISPSRAPYLIPAIVEAYMRKNPGSRITIKERTTAELNRLLTRGELDLVISLLNETGDDFEKVHLFDEDILLAVPESMYHGSETFEDILRSTTLIHVGKGLALWKTMNEIIETLGVSEPEIECQSIESALALVKRGLGAMIVPSYVQRYGTSEQNRGICFLPLPVKQYPRWKSLYQRKVCLFYRREQFLTQAERSFIECTKEVVNNNI